MAHDAIYTFSDLKNLQSLSLDRKIQISQTRIIEWIQKNNKNVFVSFSGGKDSTVLLDIVRRIDQDVPALFVNTGLEFPEIRKFALQHENVVEIRPQMPFNAVIRNFGFPILSKDISNAIFKARKPGSGKNYKLNLLGKSYFMSKDGNYKYSRYNIPKYMPICQLPIRISAECCNVMKERPATEWKRKHGMLPFIGTMADESFRRTRNWMRHGCNAFDIDEPRSAPLSIWTEQDVLKYVLKYDVEICSVYGDIVPVFGRTREEACKPPTLKCTGCQRTGCVFCCYGEHIKTVGDSRMQMLAKECKCLQKLIRNCIIIA